MANAMVKGPLARYSHTQTCCSPPGVELTAQTSPELRRQAAEGQTGSLTQGAQEHVHWWTPL